MNPQLLSLLPQQTKPPALELTLFCLNGNVSYDCYLRVQRHVCMYGWMDSEKCVCLP